MRYTLVSTFTPRSAIVVSIGAVTVTLSPHVRRTADQIIASLTAAFGATVTLARVAGKVELTWSGTGTIDLVDATLATYLGFTATTIPHTKTSGDTVIAGYLDAEVSEPWGDRSRETYRDVPGMRGRTTASESGEETTGSIGLWLHRRGDAESFAVAVAAAYAAADSWVRSELEIRTQDDDQLICTLADGWEFAPEELDAESATVRLEVIRWE